MKGLWILAMLALGLAPATSQAGHERLPQNLEPKRLVPVPDDRWEPLEIDVWIEGRSRRVFFPGEQVTVSFRTSRDAFVLLYDVDTEGQVNTIYPRNRRDPEFVRGGVVYRVPAPGSRYRLVVDGPPGEEIIMALASDEPIAPRWDRAWRGMGRDFDFDRFGDTSYRSGRLTKDRFGSMDRLHQNLIEVPVRGGRAEVVSDWASFEVGSRGRWRDGRDDSGRGRWNRGRR